MRYRFIKAHDETWPVTVQCRVLGVSTGGYYSGIARPNSRRLLDDDRFTPMIRRIFEEHQGRYGAPRITEELRALGQRINRKRVERLLREMGLRGKQKCIALLQDAARQKPPLSSGSHAPRVEETGVGHGPW